MRAVVQLTGLSADTLRIWERRHQAVVPQRGRSQRLYSEQDVNRLLLLKAAVDKGHSIGQIARLGDGELQALPVARGFTMAEAGPDSPLLELVERLLGLLSQYQVQALDLELGRLAALLSPSTLVHQVVLPLLHRVGEAWEHGQLNVAQEHLLSFSLRRVLVLLTPATRSSAPTKTLVFATPAGQHHEFGLLAAAMLATTHNLQVINVGVDVPCGDLIEVVQKSKAQGLVLGLREPFHAEDFWPCCQRLVHTLQETPILAGGPLSPSSRARLVSLGIEILETLRQLEHRFAHW